MNVWAQIGELRRELLEHIDQAVGTIARWNKTTASSSDGSSDAVESYALPDEGSTQERTRRVAPWGVAGVPVVGLAGAVVRALGGATQSILVGLAHPQYARAGLVEGETQVYCKVAGTELFLDKDGKATLAAGLTKITLTKNGDVSIEAAVNANVSVTASGTGQVNLSATPVTGKIGLGPVANLSVLVQGSLDSMGVPVTQNPVATATIVKAG